MYNRSNQATTMLMLEERFDTITKQRNEIAVLTLLLDERFSTITKKDKEIKEVKDKVAELTSTIQELANANRILKNEVIRLKGLSSTSSSDASLGSDEIKRMTSSPTPFDSFSTMPTTDSLRALSSSSVGSDTPLSPSVLPFATIISEGVRDAVTDLPDTPLMPMAATLLSTDSLRALSSSSIGSDTPLSPKANPFNPAGFNSSEKIGSNSDPLFSTDSFYDKESTYRTTSHARMLASSPYQQDKKTEERRHKRIAKIDEPYSKEKRAQVLAKFKKKKQEGKINFFNSIRYQVRKSYADARPRRGGKFVSLTAEEKAQQLEAAKKVLPSIPILK